MGHPYPSYRLPLTHKVIGHKVRQTAPRARLSSDHLRLAIRLIYRREPCQYQLDRLPHTTRRVELKIMGRYHHYHFPWMLLSTICTQ